MSSMVFAFVRLRLSITLTTHCNGPNISLDIVTYLLYIIVYSFVNCTEIFITTYVTMIAVLP